MNFQLLSQVVEELSSLIIGARVERVYQGPDGGLLIALNRDRKKFVLLLSPDRALPRLHLVAAKPPADDPPHAFILYVRSHVSGARLTNIALLNQDRVVEIRFSRSGHAYRLVFELFGPAANLLFLDSAAKILSVYYPVPPAEGAARPLLPGLLYSAAEKKRSLACVTTGPQEALPAGSGGELSPNKAAEQYYERLIGQRRDAALRSELRSFLNKAVSRTGRLANALSVDLRSAKRGDEYRQAGDLILANLNRLTTGMEHADLSGYDGKSISVTLDPRRSPAQNAERYFKKYKKAKAGMDIIAGRLSRTDDELRELKSMLHSLDQAETHDDILGIRDELISRGYRRRGTRGKGASPEAALPVRKFLFGGWEILVGKSAAGNDYLTTRLARPDDLWLHAEGLPGSHVLVRNPAGAEIPPEVLLKAASLAAFYSKGKASGKVAVTYTRAGLVRKPRGAKPGLVTLAQRKTIMVKPEDGQPAASPR